MNEVARLVSPGKGIALFEIVGSTHEKNLPEDNEAETREKLETAQEIYVYMRTQIGRSRLEQFGKGVVKLDGGKRQEVVLQAAHSFDKELYGERGFSNEEIESGIIAVWDNEEKRHYWNFTFTDEGVKAIFFEAGEDNYIRLVKYNELLQTIYTIAQLSAIPGKIFDIYESFEEFLNQLEDPDLVGITSSTADQYEGFLFGTNLEHLVEAVGRMREGNWDAGTSDRRSISMNPNDQSGYYENIIRKIDVFRNK